MSRAAATSARTLSAAQRKARVVRLVGAGKVSAKHAALVDYREPTASERALAESLVPRARKALRKHAATVA